MALLAEEMTRKMKVKKVIKALVQTQFGLNLRVDVCCGNTVCASTQGVSKVSSSTMRCRLTKNVNVRENAAIFYTNQMTNNKVL